MAVPKSRRSPSAPFSSGAPLVQAGRRRRPPGSERLWLLAESEQLPRVVRGDLAAVFIGGAGEDAIQELPRLRPRRFGMGEVVAPQHVVHADDVAQANPVVVLH